MNFTNAELYEWMSGVLGEVYSYFLQQATALAQLAENQLAFERQDTPPKFIQVDYWDVPSEAGSLTTDQKTPDRKGLTGSAFARPLSARSVRLRNRQAQAEPVADLLAQPSGPS